MQNIFDNTWYSYASLPKWKRISSMVFYG